MGSHLPSIHTILLLKTGFTWISYLKEIEMWCMAAVAGINFDVPYPNNLIPIFPSCVSYFGIFLCSIYSGKQKRLIKKILF